MAGENCDRTQSSPCEPIPDCLELQLHPKLHHPWATDCIGDFSEICSYLANNVIRSGEVNVIEDIENVPTELYTYAFSELRILREPNIEALLAKTTKNISAQIPKPTVGWITASEGHRRT